MISTEKPISNTSAPVTEPPSTPTAPPPVRTPARPFPAPNTDPTPQQQPDRNPDDDYPTCKIEHRGKLDPSCWELEYSS